MEDIYLYHGSCAGINGNNLRPRSSRGDINGKFSSGSQNLVFATDSKLQAMAYAFKTANTLLSGESPNGVVANAYFTNRDSLRDWEDEVKQSETSIYYLSKENFTQNILLTGEPSSEWQSPCSAKILQTEKVTLSEAMDNRIQFFFFKSDIDPQRLWRFVSEAKANFDLSYIDLLTAMETERLAVCLNKLTDKGYVENKPIASELVQKFKTEIGGEKQSFSQRVTVENSLNTAESTDLQR